MGSGCLNAPTIEPLWRGLVFVTLPTSGLLLTPLCSSSAPAMCSSRITFAGQRPAGEGSNVAPLRESVEPVVPDLDQSPIGTFAASRSASLMPTLLASMLSAPVPCSNTFAATVSLNGFLAATIGSTAGFNAVPQPSHCLAASVAGVVIGSGLPTACPPPCMAEDRPCEYPTTSRSAPAALS